MTMEEFTAVLSANPGAAVNILLPDGSFVPAHFHVTEVGRVKKDFVDCGGTSRSTTSCVLQVWTANDILHRLDAAKLAKIIRMGADLFETTDVPLEVEYDNGVISQYPVLAAAASPAGVTLQLGTKHTACLAADRCGVAPDAAASSDCCAPGCCP